MDLIFDPSTSAYTRTTSGRLVPAIPMPVHVGWFFVTCGCSQKFTSVRRYREHYALDHVLGLD